MQASKKYIDDHMTTFWNKNTKHNYMHSILQQKKFNTINIKFKFRILEAPLMEENMDTEILIP